MRINVAQQLAIIFVAVLASCHTVNGETPLRKSLKTGSKLNTSAVLHSPDGKLLAVATGEEEGKAELRLFSVVTEKQISVIDPKCSQISRLAFSPESKLLLTCSIDGKCLVFNSASGKLAFELPTHGEGYSTGVFSHDGKSIATSGGDGLITVYSTANGKKLHQFGDAKHQFRQIAYLKNGYIVAVGTSKFIDLFPTSPHGLARQIDPKCGPMNCFAVSPDEKKIVVCNTKGTSILLDIESGNDVATWSMTDNKTIACVVRPDGKKIAMATWSGEIVIYALEQEALVTELKLRGHRLPASSISYSHDGTRLVSSSAIETDVLEFRNLPE